MTNSNLYYVSIDGQTNTAQITDNLKRLGDVEAAGSGVLVWANDTTDLRQIHSEVSSLGVGTVLVLPIDATAMRDVPVSSRIRTFLDRHQKAA